MLAVVNSAAMNKVVHISFQIIVFAGYAQEWDCWIIWQFYFFLFFSEKYILEIEYSRLGERIDEGEGCRRMGGNVYKP